MNNTRLKEGQRHNIIDSILRSDKMTIRKFVGRGRKIGFDIPLKEDIASGYSLATFVSDNIQLLDFGVSDELILTWAHELGIDTTNVDEYYM